MDKKLEKLQKVLEIASRDTISAKEIEKFLVLVLNTIKIEKDNLGNISSEKLESIDKALAVIEQKRNDLVELIDNKLSKTKTDFSIELGLVKSLLVEVKKIKSTPGKDGKNGYTPIKGEDYFDGKDGYSPIKGKDYFDGEKGEKGDNGSPDTPDEVTDKVNLGKPLIKKERIEGLIDIENNLKHNLYTGISETRALELIRDNPSSTPSGGTWGSITGTLSNQTDLQSALDAKAPITSPTFATSITGSYLTASEMLITDGSKNIISAPVATYPSLTELTYLKGVTAAIQTQINAKGTGNVTKVGTPVNNQVGVWTGDGTLEGDTNFTWSGTSLGVNGGAIFNESGADVDFRIEGDTDQNLFFADASLDRISIGHSTPQYKLDILASGTINTGTGGYGANPGSFSITAPNFGLGDYGGTFMLTANSNLGAGNGGDIAFASRYITASAADLVFAKIKGGKENATSGNYNGYFAIAVNNHNTAIITERFRVTSQGLITLGGTSSSSPALKPNGTAINFRLADDSADAAITAAGATFSGTLALGANSITMTGSLAATGARVTKGWFTDIESTNMPTVGGTAIISDTTYGSGWNGSTNVAPSQNAVYDKIESLTGGSTTAVDSNQSVYNNYELDFTGSGATPTGDTWTVNGTLNSATRWNGKLFRVTFGTNTDITQFLPGNIGSSSAFLQFGNAKDITISFNAKFSSVSGQVGIGIADSTDVFYNVATSAGKMVFTYNGTTLNAVSGETSNTTTDVSAGITRTNWNAYKIVYTYGTDVKFYINNTLVATHTTNLPTSSSNARFGIGGATSTDTSEIANVVISVEK